MRLTFYLVGPAGFEPATNRIVAGWSLKAASEDIFTKGLEAGTASASGEVLSVVDNAVKFESGKLILTDAKYNLDWLKTAKAALNNADSGTMGLVVTGTLVNADDGKELTEAKADDLADTGAVHAGVTGKVDTNDVTIGSGGLENLGVAGANSGGNLNASVAITNDDSKVNVDAGTFKVDAISAEKGTISVNEGAALKTDSLTVGTEGSTTNITGAGALEAKEMNINKGTVAVTGSLKAESLTVNDSGATITVGDSGSAGSLAAKAVELKGSSIVLDPVWNGVSNITTASKGALEFASAVDGKLTVGQNSVLSLGTNDTSKAEAVFANSGLSWGEQDITAALYIDKVQTLDTTSGGIKVDGNLTHGSGLSNFAQAGTADFANQSLLMVNSSLLGDNVGALSATGGTLTVTAGAKLYIENAEAGKTYTVVSGFNNGSDVKGWGLDEANNLLLNKLVTVVENGIKFDNGNGTYTVETAKVNAKTALPGVALPNILNAMTQDVDSEYAGIKYLRFSVILILMRRLSQRSTALPRAQKTAALPIVALWRPSPSAILSKAACRWQATSLPRRAAKVRAPTPPITAAFGRSISTTKIKSIIWVASATTASTTALSSAATLRRPANITAA